MLEQGISMIAPVAIEVSEPCDAWGGLNQVGVGGATSRLSAPLTTQGRALIKKFNSTTAAPSSQHSEVLPCEGWCRLIRRGQILWCGRGGAAAAHGPSRRGCWGDAAHLFALFAISQLSRVR